jgi:anti-sigma B factor antagonist
MTFSISTTDAGVTRLAIEGELDAVTVSDLRGDIEKLLARRPSRVEVDLSMLRMLDSSGVGALVSLYKRVRAQGGDVVVMGLRDQPLAIFRLLRLDRVMVGAELKTPSPSSSSQKHSNSKN